MLNSVIHDPRAVSTPSQRSAASAHLQRLQRFQSAARAERVTPKQVFSAPPIEAEVLPPIPDAMIRRAFEMFPASGVIWSQVETIQRAVADEFPGVTLSDIKSARRTADVVKPRQIAMYLCKTMTSQSFPAIGRKFGGRDHTTILHATQKMTRLVKDDAGLAFIIDKIKANIAERTR